MFHRFFSSGIFHRLASTKVQVNSMAENPVKKLKQLPDGAIKQVEQSTKRKVLIPEKPLREITQEERDKLCEQLEEASRRATYY